MVVHVDPCEKNTAIILSSSQMKTENEHVWCLKYKSLSGQVNCAVVNCFLHCLITSKDLFRLFKMTYKHISLLLTSIQFHKNCGFFDNDITVSILYGMKVQLCICLQFSIPAITAHHINIIMHIVNINILINIALRALNGTNGHCPLCSKQYMVTDMTVRVSFWAVKKIQKT